jgi:hypothetical protein
MDKEASWGSVLVHLSGYKKIPHVGYFIKNMNSSSHTFRVWSGAGKRKSVPCFQDALRCCTLTWWEVEGQQGWTLCLHMEEDMAGNEPAPQYLL